MQDAICWKCGNAKDAIETIISATYTLDALLFHVQQWMIHRQINLQYKITVLFYFQVIDLIVSLGFFALVSFWKVLSLEN